MSGGVGAGIAPVAHAPEETKTAEPQAASLGGPPAVTAGTAGSQSEQAAADSAAVGGGAATVVAAPGAASVTDQNGDAPSPTSIDSDDEDGKPMDTGKDVLEEARKEEVRVCFYCLCQHCLDQSINQTVYNVLFLCLHGLDGYSLNPQQLLHLSLSNGSTLCVPYFLSSHLILCSHVFLGLPTSLYIFRSSRLLAVFSRPLGFCVTRE